MKYLFLFAILFHPVTIKALESLTLSGNVLNSSGDELVGANVSIIGSSFGTATDYTGRYSFEVLTGSLPEIIMLKASYIGYQSEIDTIDLRELSDNFTDVNFTLAADVMLLESVVVTGIGIKQETKKLGVSIETVRKEKVENSPEVSLVSALEAMCLVLKYVKLVVMQARMHSFEFEEQEQYLEAMNPWSLLMEVLSALVH